MTQASNIIPAWPFRLNWENGYTETLEWKTVVLPSRIGAEQRYAARIGPRRKLDLVFLVDRDERTYLDTMLSAYGGSAWYVPLPHDTVGIGAVDSGQTTFNFDTTNREFSVGGHVAIQGRQAWEWDVLTVASVTDTGITTVETPALSYDAATIAPAVLSRLTDKVTTSRVTSRISSGSLQFMQIEPVVWPPVARDLTTRIITQDTLTAPILLQEPDAVEDLAYEYQRTMKVVDNEVATPVYTDPIGQTLTMNAYSWALYGAADRSYFRDFLFSVAGQRSPIWVPTFNDDLSSTPSWITANPNGRVPATPGNRQLAIAFHRDGSIVVHSASVATNGALPTGVFSSSTISRISYLDLKRLSQDAVEIQHETDGVANVKLTLIDAPDFRVAADYTNLAFPSTSQRQADGTDIPATNTPTGLVSTVTITGPAGGS